MQPLRKIRARTSNCCQWQRIRPQTPCVQTPSPDTWSKWTGFCSKKENCLSNPQNKPDVICQCIPRSPQIRPENDRIFSHNSTIRAIKEKYETIWPNFSMFIARALFWCHWCFLVKFSVIMSQTTNSFFSNLCGVFLFSMILSTGISGVNVSLVLNLGYLKIYTNWKWLWLPIFSLPVEAPFIICDVFVSAPPAVQVLRPLV